MKHRPSSSTCRWKWAHPKRSEFPCARREGRRPGGSPTRDPDRQARRRRCRPHDRRFRSGWSLAIIDRRRRSNRDRRVVRAILSAPIAGLGDGSRSSGGGESPRAPSRRRSPGIARGDTVGRRRAEPEVRTSGRDTSRRRPSSRHSRGLDLRRVRPARSAPVLVHFLASAWLPPDAPPQFEGQPPPSVLWSCPQSW